MPGRRRTRAGARGTHNVAAAESTHTKVVHVKPKSKGPRTFGSVLPSYMRPTAAAVSAQSPVKHHYMGIKNSAAARAVRKLIEGKREFAAAEREAARKAAEIRQMPLQMVADMKVDRVKAMKAAELAALSPKQVTVLKKEHIMALDSEQIKGLNKSAVAALTKEQVKVLTIDQVTAMSDDQLGAMSPEQVVTFTKQLTKEDAKLNEIASLPTLKREALVKFLEMHTTTTDKEAQMMSIAKFQVSKASSLEPQHVKALRPAQLQRLSISQVEHMTPKMVQNLSPQQVKAFTPVQLAALSPAAGFALPSEALTHLSIEQKAALPPDVLAAAVPTMGTLDAQLLMGPSSGLSYEYEDIKRVYSYTIYF